MTTGIVREHREHATSACELSYKTARECHLILLQCRIRIGYVPRIFRVECELPVAASNEVTMYMYGQRFRGCLVNLPMRPCG